MAAATVLGKADPDWFRERLKRLAVCLAFDDVAASTSEGQVALDLTLDMLARFYPGIKVLELGETERTRAAAVRLKKAAKAIHPHIDLSVSPARISCCLVVGATQPPLDVPTVFLGSEGWTAILRHSEPAGCCDSGNPFGAAAAACIGVAALFRKVFAEELGRSAEEGPLDIDVLHHRTRRSLANPRLPAVIDLGCSHLVGLGAIGRATCWTLARVESLSGELHGVDGERMDLSNLQRYVGATQEDVRKGGRLKTHSVARMFSGDRPSNLRFVGHPSVWGEFLRDNPEVNLDKVAVALDTAADRIAVQASLPRHVLNAWTQPGDLGVSRHYDFDTQPCLACLYLPSGEAKSLSFLVAESLCLPEAEVRSLLHSGYCVEATFLRRVAEAAKIPLDALLPFANHPLRMFYSKAVCGTTHFAANPNARRGEAAVPMAFQSVLAGVLLAAELVADSAPLRTMPMPPLTKMNLLAQMGSQLLEPAVKHASGRCLCQDHIYRRNYKKKFSGACDPVDAFSQVA
jgi:hypothetical protein